MKITLKRLPAIALAAVLLFAAVAARAQQPYTFDHGPYLQGLTDTSIKVYFTTSEQGFSKVELRRTGSDAISEYAPVDDGLIEAYNTANAIGIEGLLPATAYQYRLVSTQITDFQPYDIKFGEHITSPWYDFRTLDPDAEQCSFVALSDIHDDAQKYQRLLSYMPLEETDAVFLAGDMMSYFDKPEQPYTSFIDISVDMFAKEKPFVVVRGNHETRGNLARTYGQYVYRPAGHYYGLYTMGKTVVVMLDAGEDKPDTSPVYGGLGAFDRYREQQAEWLGQAVKSREFRQAERRIVIVHIPPYIPGKSGPAEPVEWDHGAQMVDEVFMPILNEEKIDLMICGHNHRQSLVEVEKGVNNFPIVINDDRSASFVTSSPEGVRVKTVDLEGETTLDRIFE